MSLLDTAIASKIKKAQDQQEKADKQLQASKINNGIIELAKQSGDPRDLENVTTVLEHIGNTDPDVSKIIFQSIESRIKDKTNFQQTMEAEKFKSKMSFIPELTKVMASSGNYSPEQIQEFAGLAAEKAQGGIGQRIVQTVTQPNQAPQQAPADAPSEAQSLFSNPLPQRKTEKMRNRDKELEKGRGLIQGLRNKFVEIDDKYGVGRIKGQLTGIRGALGDILPKEEQAPEVAVYNGLLDGASVFVGKNVWNDDRVAVDDRTAYKKSIANLTNTREEGELMFDALEEFSNTDDPKLQTALQLMIPYKGKGSSLSPSQALSEQGLLKVAVNKKTGEKLYQDKKTGKWRPLQNKNK